MRCSPLRKVERQHLVAVPVLRGGLPDVEVAEERVEIILLREVVVAAEHVQEQRLAESPRAHEEEEPSTQLQRADVAGLVDEVQVFLTKGLEVAHAVGELEVAVAHWRILYQSPPCTRKGAKVQTACGGAIRWNAAQVRCRSAKAVNTGTSCRRHSAARLRAAAAGAPSRGARARRRRPSRPSRTHRTRIA